MESVIVDLGLIGKILLTMEKLCYNDNDLTSTDEYSFPYNSNNF